MAILNQILFFKVRLQIIRIKSLILAFNMYSADCSRARCIDSVRREQEFHENVRVSLLK